MSKQLPWQLTIRAGWQTYLPELFQAVDNGEEQAAIDTFLQIFDHALNHSGWGSKAALDWSEQAIIQQHESMLEALLAEIITACNLTSEDYYYS